MKIYTVLILLFILQREQSRLLESSNKVLLDSNQPQEVENVWEQTKSPEKVVTHVEEQKDQIINGFYDNEVLLDNQHQDENKQRKENYPHIQISTKILNEMVQQLKHYQDFLIDGKDQQILDQGKVTKKDDERLQQKLAEKEKAEEKQKKISELEDQVNDLSDKIEELSGKYPTTELLEEIESDREKMEELLMNIKDLKQEDQPIVHEKINFDKYIASQENTIEEIDQMIQQVTNELQSMENKKQVESNKAYYDQLQDYLKDLYMTKADKLQLINDEKKAEKLKQDIEDAQKNVKELEKENVKLEIYESKTEEQDKKKDINKEILNDLTNQKPKDEKSEAMRRLEKELEDAIESEQELKNQQQQLQKTTEIEKKIIKDENEIEKIDETIIDVMSKENHEGVVHDAKLRRDELLDEIENLKKPVKEFTANYKNTPLKHKLDLTMNPMYYSLKGILDKNYANTEDFGDYIADMDVMQGDGAGLTKLRTIQSAVNLVQEKVDLLFKDLPSTIDKVPTNTNSEVVDSLEMLDRLVSFLNEFDIEKTVVDQLILEIKELLNGMIMTFDEMLDFFQLIEEYNQIKVDTEFTTNIKIIQYKEEIQSKGSEFNKSVEYIKEALDGLQNLMFNLNNEIQRLDNAIPEEARLKTNNYSKKRLNLLDFVVEEIPELLNKKIKIDEKIQSLTVYVAKVGKMRGDILSNIDLIEKELLVETKKEEIVEEKTSKFFSFFSKSGRIFSITLILMFLQ